MFRELLHLLRSDNLMKLALDECYAMLDLCHPMVHSAIDSLRVDRTELPDVDVYALDKRLNRFERDVRRKIVTHLALGRKPDTSAGLTLMSIVIDIERIGDYSKNIVDLARARTTRLRVAEHEELTSQVETAALGLFDRAVTTFKSGDIEAARLIMTGYKSDVSRQCRQIEQDLVRGTTSLSPADAVTLALYVRFLKRITAHCRNLVSAIVNPVDRIGYSE